MQERLLDVRMNPEANVCRAVKDLIWLLIEADPFEPSFCVLPLTVFSM